MRLMTIKSVVCALGALCLGPLAPAQAQAQEEDKVLNIYNRSDYIAEDTIRNFEKETGIRVRYDNIDNNEILHANLVAGKTGYDIVVPSSHWAKLQLDGGLLRRLDKAQIPNLKNLDPAVQAALGRMDPGNEHMVNWLWGYTLGRPPYSHIASDYSAVAALLKSVRPHITLFSSSGYINDMANGSVAPRPGNAHKFINYILRPEVHAGLTNKVFYANPNTESRRFIKPEVANNPTVFLSAADLARMLPPDSLNNDLRRLMTRTYTSFKTGI